MARSIITTPLDDSTRLDADGNPWPYALLFGEQTVLSDKLAEIISFLMPEYADFPDDEDGDNEALVYRWAQAVQTANFVQSSLSAEAAQAKSFIPTEESDQILTALLGDRQYPVDGIDTWEHVVPLVLVATDYLPYTDRPAPKGNVRWIDPHDEFTFLDSLSKLGLMEFFVYNGAAAA